MFRTLSVFSLFAFTLSAQAEIMLTQQDILGAWRVDSESISADGKGAKSLDTVWTFRADGTMEGFSKDANANTRLPEFRSTLNYSIVDGKIQKQIAPGRSRTQDCVAIEKNGNKMLLDCNHIYFSMTKQ